MDNSRSSTLVVQGTVRATLPAGAAAGHQVTIVTPQDVVYHVEPTFIGATLWRLDGYRVAARAHLVRGTGGHTIIRVDSLTIFGRDRADERPPSAQLPADAAAPPIDAEPRALEVGGVES